MNVTLTALCGSLRAQSLNRKLLNAVVAAAPDGVTIEAFGLEGIPLYNQDLEDSEGIPAAVTRIKDSLAQAAGLLIATPEYNNSIPGPLKNALDWMTRPPAETRQVFHAKAVALVGATPGPRGTILAQTAWLPIFRALAMRPFYEKVVYAGGAGSLFGPQGEITDEAMGKRINGFIQGFAAFAAGA